MKYNFDATDVANFYYINLGITLTETVTDEQVEQFGNEYNAVNAMDTMVLESFNNWLISFKDRTGIK